MDGFSYTNMFDTKGIEYLIIIGFLLLIIPFWIALNRPLKARRPLMESFGVLLFDILRIPEGLFYSKNHTWIYMERSGNARIGLDDLLLHITGNVEVSNIKDSGEKVSKGDLLAVISQNGKKLEITSPVSGEIAAVNSSLNEKPEILVNDPYGMGWFYEIKPVNWIEETSPLFMAEEAREWMKKEMQRFKDFIAVSIQKHTAQTDLVILQEGGELADHPLSEMPDEVWEDFQHSFLNIRD